MLFPYSDSAPPELYTLSLHDALPIFTCCSTDDRYADDMHYMGGAHMTGNLEWGSSFLDRKSTRLNSSHPSIAYAVFCLKKKTSHVGLPPMETRMSVTAVSTCYSTEPC